MELVSATKKKRVSHEGFFYIADYVRDVKTYMKCSVWRRNGCRGRGILREDVFTPTGAHNHAPSPSVIERAKARAEMKDRARNTTEPGHAIRATAEAGMSQAARADMPRDADIMRAISRYRHDAGGAAAQPRTLEELNIPYEMMLTIERPGVPAARFVLYDSATDMEYVGPRIVVYGSDWGVNHLAQSRHWAADGTFKVVPGIFEQLYTVHASVLGQTVPCIYAMLPNKTEATYRHLFAVIRAEVEARHPDAAGLTGGSVITDLEKAALNAFQAVFPEKECALCFFHLSQAVWRKAQQTGLQAHYGADADFALKVSLTQVNKSHWLSSGSGYFARGREDNLHFFISKESTWGSIL